MIEPAARRLCAAHRAGAAQSWRSQAAPRRRRRSCFSPGNGMPTLARRAVRGDRDAATRARSRSRRSAARSPRRSRCSSLNVRSRRRRTRAHRRGAAAAPTTGSTARWSIAATSRRSALQADRRIGRDRHLVARVRKAFRARTTAARPSADIIFELANAIAQPFGVITANDRAKRLGTGSSTRATAACSRRATHCAHSIPAAQARVRDGLEQLIAIDPNFAAGFTHARGLYAREYMTGFGARPGDAPPLDRALKAARRGIELGRRARAAITSCSSSCSFAARRRPRSRPPRRRSRSTRTMC